MPIPGEPVWMELTTSDASKAHTFYGELFGWSFHDQGEEFGHYQIISQGDSEIGGAMVKQAEWGEMPDTFALYLSTTDIDATTTAVREAGGRVLVEPMAVGTQGSMAFYQDAAGAAVGAWQGGTRVGMAKLGMFQSGWYELMTNAYPAAIEFYPKAFGATVVPMGEQTDQWAYSTIGQGRDAVAGICDASEWLKDPMPSYWRIYVNVPDVDQTIETLVPLGGRVVDGPMDSPFGRLATVADDQGAMFQIITPAQQPQ
ncbi:MULTISPECIES: VOC family protein [Aestuariimicrobium]|uniref:VOC family protein n=1 Tax=Aestuariimicrobium TaxID=396388 RepID=UPI0003B351A8|nr:MULTISPECIES: VOC family protein [Aestuariimicrobium]CAI9401462.1 Putative glyoxylase CFP32 [Aestuariimicrobium sp. T2.26MG-19.2B]